MKMLFVFTALIISPAIYAQMYIHNTLPHVYGNPQVNKKEGYLTYRTVDGDKVRVDLSEVSETTSKRINGVKENEVALLDGNICQAFYVAKSGRAEFTCRTGIIYTDSINGKTHFLKKFVKDTSEVIPEVEEMDGMRKGNFVKLQVPVENLTAGEEVRIEAVLANGEVLIRRTGFLRMALIQSGGSVVRDISTIKVNIADLCKCN